MYIHIVCFLSVLYKLLLCWWVLPGLEKSASCDSAWESRLYMHWSFLVCW